MAKFNVGDPVKAMYNHGRYGTVLGTGRVTAVEPRDDGGSWVTVQLTGEEAREQRYVVSKSGATDYLLTMAESAQLGGK
jgi:hypothetical protein